MLGASPSSKATSASLSALCSSSQLVGTLGAEMAQRSACGAVGDTCGLERDPQEAGSPPQAPLEVSGAAA